MPDNLEVFKAYEDGKHRRYNLLFSVNGGAFAIAKLLAKMPPEQQRVIGSLHQWHLSAAMAAFTILMVYDIYKFGDKMSSLQKSLDRFEIFGRPGKVVLVAIGILLCVVWLLAAFTYRVNSAPTQFLF